MKELSGKPVVFTVSDPWDFETDNGTPRIVGRIEVAEGRGVLIRAKEQFACAGKSYGFVLCTFRHEDKGVGLLECGESVSCNGIAVPDARLDQARGLDSSWWRGGAGLVGEVCLV